LPRSLRPALTDDDLAQINGKREKLEGKLQQLYAHGNEQAKKEIDDFLGGPQIDLESLKLLWAIIIFSYFRPKRLNATVPPLLPNECQSASASARLWAFG
jgi:hypothetical protein